MGFQLARKKNWADFVGKWPPTFFAIGIHHKVVRPGRAEAIRLKELLHNSGLRRVNLEQGGVTRPLRMGTVTIGCAGSGQQLASV